MTDRELLQQALDALEAWDARGRLRIIEAIRTRLARPKNEWVGLTDEDRWELVQKTPSFDEAVAAVEAKLKEKNT